jgi:hypothetical protein
MAIDGIELALMRSIAEHEAEIGTLPDRQVSIFRAEEVAALKRNGPLYSPRLVADEVDERARVRLLKAAHGLAAKGLVLLTRQNGRLRHVKLTEAGRAALAGVATDPHNIAAPDPFVTKDGE